MNAANPECHERGCFYVESYIDSGVFWCKQCQQGPEHSRIVILLNRDEKYRAERRSSHLKRKDGKRTHVER